jgi:hypothetical protein
MAVVPTLNGTYYEITVPGNVIWLMTTMTNGAAPNLTSTYKVINDITINSADVSGNPLESICKTTVASEGPFIGVFDGQGFTITINLSSIITTNYFGLFGYVGNGSLTGISISNLNVTYACNTITYTDGAVSGTSYFGSLVGYCNRATISNCNITYLNAVVITHIETTRTRVTNTGGICGLMANGSTLSNSTIQFNDIASLLCDVTGATTFPAERNVGGICGYIGQFSSTINNLINCSLKVTKNTTIGSTINVRRVGGLVGGAFGGLNFSGCSVVETSSSALGTFRLQASVSPLIPISNSVIIGGLIGEADFRTTANPIIDCSIQLDHYTFSIYVNTFGSLFATAMLIALLNATTISGGRIFLRTLTAQVNNIDINATGVNGSTSEYRIGGLFGSATNILDISGCSVTSLNDYTVILSAPGTGSAPNCQYGGIISSAILGTSPIDSPPSTYRTISNCNLTVNGITNVQVNQNGTGNAAPSLSYFGGLFGLMSGGRQLTNNLPGVPLIIDNCNLICKKDVSFSLIHTNTSTPPIGVALYVGGLFGQSLGCTVTSCNGTFGVSNNTITISSSTKTHTTSFVSCGFANISNAGSSLVSIQAITTIDNCNVTINGNTSVTANALTTVGMSTITGGLLGRINNGSTCSNSSFTNTGTLTITTVSTADSATIGGLAGDIISTAALGPSTLSSCQGTIGGACTFNSNINTSFRGIVGGMAGLIAAFGRMDTNTITYNGSLTMTSTNPSGGTRYIGGLVGLSTDGSNLSKIITGSSITVNGAVVITLGSVVENNAGGLFGRLTDGTACSACSGIYNSTLSITNNGTTSGGKTIGGLCGNVANSATTAAATITTSSITVRSTTQLISTVNVTGNTTYSGIILGFISDAATNGGTFASFCTGTFYDKVTINVTNSNTTGTVYMGGIVGNNFRSQIDSITLNLLNGADIYNNSSTNAACYSGLIVGSSGPAILNNVAEIINSTVNVSGTVLIDANSSTSIVIAGGLGGQIDSRFENNTVNGENCVFTINSTSATSSSTGGGLIGLISNTVFQSYNVTNNTFRAGSLNVNVSGTPLPAQQATFVAGTIARIRNVADASGNAQKIIVSNNSVLVGNSTILQNVIRNQTVYVSLLFGNIEVVTLSDPTIIANNTFLTGNTITITASNLSPTIYINDLVAFYTAGTATFPNNTAYICKIDPYTLLNFQSYPSADANGLTIYGTNYPITSEYIVPAVYKIDVLPAITVIITCIIPPVIPVVPVTCCTANICDKNPQVANYSNEVIINRKGGQALIANVNEIYASQRTNTARIRVTPVFSSYQQYMTYLQSKNSI